MTTKLGLLISEEKMKCLPLELQEKYLKQKRENELNELTDEILAEFASFDYERALYRFVEYLSSTDEETREMLKEHEVIKEAVTSAIYLSFSEAINTANQISHLDKAIREIFGTGLGREPWIGKFLENVRKYPLDLGYLDYVLETVKKVGIEKEYKKAMGENLKKIEEHGITLVTFEARQKLDMQIDGDYATRVRGSGDGSLKIGQYSYAMRIYKALAEAGHGDEGMRDKMAVIYYSNAPEAHSIEIIKKLAIDSGIISKPIEHPIVDVTETEQVPDRPWWKFW